MCTIAKNKLDKSTKIQIVILATLISVLIGYVVDLLLKHQNATSSDVSPFDRPNISLEKFSGTIQAQLDCSQLYLLVSCILLVIGYVYKQCSSYTRIQHVEE